MGKSLQSPKLDVVSLTLFSYGQGVLKSNRRLGNGGGTTRTHKKETGRQDVVLY